MFKNRQRGLPAIPVQNEDHMRMNEMGNSTERNQSTNNLSGGASGTNQTHEHHSGANGTSTHISYPIGASGTIESSTMLLAASNEAVKTRKSSTRINNLEDSENVEDFTDSSLELSQ